MATDETPNSPRFKASINGDGTPGGYSRREFGPKDPRTPVPNAVIYALEADVREIQSDLERIEGLVRDQSGRFATRDDLERVENLVRDLPTQFLEATVQAQTRRELADSEAIARRELAEQEAIARREVAAAEAERLREVAASEERKGRLTLLREITKSTGDAVKALVTSTIIQAFLGAALFAAVGLTCAGLSPGSKRLEVFDLLNFASDGAPPDTRPLPEPNTPPPEPTE